ncbi:MAG: MerR family transcriptional regulator [Ruminococcaceae bacterium]|nr:MerR family transcriptional regulator [Oscillospiraceae bacterium]
MQIKKFAELTGVSVRTLHYYDEIGLLKPSIVDRFTGYRYYDESSVLRMQEILFYRELDFSLKSIAEILSSPNYDREKALKEQKKLLTLKKERLERLILSIDNAVKGENVMSAFDNSEFEAYKSEAKEKWGNTEAYAEFSEKTKDYSKERFADINTGLEYIFRDFAELMKSGAEPISAEAQALVKKLQKYITENYYTCNDEILKGLGQMYIADERFKNNIDKYADGTAEFASEAIRIYFE